MSRPYSGNRFSVGHRAAPTAREPSAELPGEPSVLSWCAFASSASDLKPLRG
jgi:hypothetical protein